MERLVTQKELAECLRITTRQIRNLKQDGLFQEAMVGKKYDLPRCVAEYIDFKVKAETGTGAKISIERVKIEHEEIKKNISKLKLRRLRRELHEAADVEYYLMDMLIRFKRHLLSVANKIAMKAAAENDINKMLQIVSKELEDALSELSEYDPDKIDGTVSPDFDGGEEDEDDEEEDEED